MTETSPAAYPPEANAGPEKRGLPVAVMVAAVFALIVLGGVYMITARRPKPQPPAAPSQEAMAYAEQLSVSDLHMTAEENFLGQEVVYLNGKVTNRGDQIVAGLQVRLYFYDTLSQVVLKEDRELLDTPSAPLRPGEARTFQVRFDRVPPSWNVQVPQFQLLSVQVQ